MDENGETVAARDTERRLDLFLTARYPDFSRTRIKGLVENGFVTVDGVVVTKPALPVDERNDIVVTFPPPVPAEPQPEDLPLDILFEDDDLLVVNKSAGMVVHPAPGHLGGTLVNAVLAHCPTLKGIGGVARPGIVHRLDRDTSGALAVAKSQRAMELLAADFATHTNLRKIYVTLVHGMPTPASGRLETLIGRSPFDRKKMAVVTRNGKRAVTNYRACDPADGVPGLAGASPLPSGVTPVICDIETGRTHQIRVHMRMLGCPVVGDADYGSPSADRRLPHPPARQLLHAWKLMIRHPVTRQDLCFTAPIPRDFVL